ncbi:hypothetical protein H072_6202 [Dactylellina haptotyla CBS 200.50]|uniref:Uncharacterized protein n=1 Tax=Dactylellina haptotyla (strain CBS 200.50) TaxID=1284197 RepID=S8BX91_DACHA|nr:hypothetical protein H072_6202 [Dactylellina haptotyla CBS 200.50]
MRIVSSTLMRSVIASVEGNPVLRFEGKSSPIEDNTPWRFLHWCPESPMRSNRTPANHLMLRFGEAPPVERTGPIRKPGPNCLAAIQYLVHRSDLGLHDGDDPNDHRHESCSVALPVGIFWGLLGLRTLNRWHVVKAMLQESLWLGTNGPPGTDPEPYRPVTGVLPDGLYLKIWIAVPYSRDPLTSCFFRFDRYGEIVVDGEQSCDEGSETEREDNGDSGDDDAHSSSFRDDPDFGVAAAANQLVRHGHAFTRKGSSTSGRTRRSNSMYSPQEGFSQDLAVADRRGIGLSPPLIPPSLLMEELYLSNEPLEKDRILLPQTSDERKNLIDHGTGLPLKYLPSAAEIYGQGYGLGGYQQNQIPREHRERKHEGERRRRRRATLDRLPAYPQGRHPQEPRGDFPLAPARNFEGVNYESGGFHRRAPDDYADPDDDASHYSSSGHGSRSSRQRFDDDMEVWDDDTSQSSVGTDSYHLAAYQDDNEGSVYGDTVDEDMLMAFMEQGPPGRRGHTHYPAYYGEDARAAEEARIMAMIAEDDSRRNWKRHR